METFAQVRQWIQPIYYVVGLDLKDQFLSVINGRFEGCIAPKSLAVVKGCWEAFGPF